VSHVQLTEAGTIKGKPGYLAPEQAEGAAFDGRVDLFALGVTLWECLAGESLFGADDFSTMVRNTFEKTVSPLAAVRKDVPPALEALVTRLLERDVAQRLPSARVALQQLRRLEAPNGQKELAAAVDLALRSTVSSAVGLGAVKQTPAVSPDAPTIGR
jgi:serine/threonine-protein kinase